MILDAMGDMGLRAKVTFWDPEYTMFPNTGEGTAAASTTAQSMMVSFFMTWSS
jgi:hypothetical protein